MEFKPYKNYTSDQICVLYTLSQVKDRHSFTQKMVNEGKIRYDGKTKTYTITDESLKNLFDGIAESVREERMEVVRRIMDLFPKGNKHYGDNGHVPWRGSEALVRRKLDAMFAFNGAPVDDETLVEAARNYVASFNGDTTKMRILPYFILKKENNELDSDMLKEVEKIRNGEQTQPVASGDWTSSMV